MHVFEMVVWIVAISCIAGIVNTYMKQKSGGRQTRDLEARLEQRLARIETLEKRVQVLEKIVTDSNYDLKRELNQL